MMTVVRVKEQKIVHLLNGSAGISQPESQSSTPRTDTSSSIALTAFGLSLAGLIIQAISALAMVVMFFVFPYHGYGGWMMYGGGMMGGFPNMMGFGYSVYPWMMAVNVVVIALIIALGAIGTSMLRSGHAGTVATGSALVLVAAVIAYPTMWGFGIGSVLMFVGAIIGLVSPK